MKIYETAGIPIYNAAALNKIKQMYDEPEGPKLYDAVQRAYDRELALDTAVAWSNASTD